MRSKLMITTAVLLFAMLSFMVTPALATSTDDNYTFTSKALACGANTVQIPETVVRGDSGFTQKLAELTVDSTLQGKVASVTAQATNNGSVHPGTTIIVSSSSTSFNLDDVEGTADKVTTATGSLTLGTTVDFTVKLGSDEVFSGGGELDVNVECPVTGGRGADVPTTPVVTPPQVKAPVGPVNAGLGGGTTLSIAAITGMVISLIALGYGALRFKNSRV